MTTTPDDRQRAAIAAAAIALSRAGLARRVPVPAATHPDGVRPSLWALAGRLEAQRTSPARGRW